MIIYIQIVIMCVLLLTLTALYIDEKRRKKTKAPKGKITRFWDGTDRRRFVRIDADVPLQYSFPKGSNNVKAKKTNNISVGGICTTVSEKLNPHDRMSLEIGLPGFSSPLLAKGEVAWVKEDTEQKDEQGIRHFDVGIEFREISPRDTVRLFNFIKERGKT